MVNVRQFRFGVVAANATSGEEWLNKARRVESLGYSTLVMPDGLKYSLAPLPALAAAAAVTTTLRLGTYVIANDYRNPVLLAKDSATLDFLSGGRFELGIGAGRPDAANDNRTLGIPFDSGAVRLDRLSESLASIKSLLAADENAEIDPRPVQRPRPPILVAGSGKRMLQLAAREADIVALGVSPTAAEQEVAEKIGWLRDAAGDRFGDIELNLNLMAVGQQVPRYISMQLGLTAAGLAEAGAVSALIGSVEEMCATLLERRERLGISYIMVSDELMETFAPVVERLAGR
jgi:probable F420-dependent oxidoreductase